jgi:hypothetical protein
MLQKRYRNTIPFAPLHRESQREQAIDEFYKDLLKIKGNKFGRIIADAFVQWFDDPTQAPSLKNTRNPTLYHDGFASDVYNGYITTALAHQQEIGWMNATRGFLAKEWHNVACTQIEIPGLHGVQYSQRDDGQQRVYQVVRNLYKLVSAIWQIRNDVLHRQGQANEEILRTAMDAEIARLHCDPQMMPAADQHYCNHTLAFILKKPPTYKRRWLHRVRQAIDRHKQDQSKTQQITKFFTRVPGATRSDLVAKLTTNGRVGWRFKSRLCFFAPYRAHGNTDPAKSLNCVPPPTRIVTRFMTC